MRRSSIFMALLLLACSDATTSGEAASADVPTRRLDPGRDAVAQDAVGPPADGAAPGCLADHGIVAGRRAETGPEGRAALYDAASETYLSLVAVDAAGMPLVEATVHLVTDGTVFTALVTAPGRLPTLVNAVGAPRLAFGLDAQVQLHEGVAAVEGRAPTVVAPDCLRPGMVLELHSRHLPVNRGVARLLVSPWLDQRCPGDGWEASCAVVEGLAERLGDELPVGLAVRTEAPELGGLQGLGSLDADWSALRAASCAEALGASLVRWAESEALLARLRVVAQRTELLLVRLSRDAPGAVAGASDELASLLVPLARIAWLLRTGGIDLHPESTGQRFLARNAFLGAVEAVKAYADGIPHGLAFDAPYEALLLGGEVPPIDGLAFRLSRESGLGVDCAMAVVTDLDAGLTITVDTAVLRMLDVLEAGLSHIERHWPDPGDAGPSPDAQIDAGPPPDAGPPAPDAFVPMGPECLADADEPNDEWPPLVEGRHPVGGVELDELTLLPDDEDWYIYEIENPSLDVRVRLDASDHCGGHPGVRVCVELWKWSWVMDQGLEEGPERLRRPICGPVADGLDTGRFGADGLANQPWIAVLVHVYREDERRSPAAYQLVLSH